MRRRRSATACSTTSSVVARSHVSSISSSSGRSRAILHYTATLSSRWTKSPADTGQLHRPRDAPAGDKDVVTRRIADQSPRFTARRAHRPRAQAQARTCANCAAPGPLWGLDLPEVGVVLAPREVFHRGNGATPARVTSQGLSARWRGGHASCRAVLVVRVLVGVGDDAGRVHPCWRADLAALRERAHDWLAAPRLA